MNIENFEKPIIATWGFGPSYRRRIKEQILQSVKSGYENIMEYAILTDLPEDFEELAKETGKIKLITNIHDVRKDYEWSIEKEPIPDGTDDKKYAKEYIENYNNQNNFSYALHRYQLPTLAENGYKKILFMDSDMKINYHKIGIEFSEEEFWNEFDTPINSMKGCIAQRLGIIDATHWQFANCLGPMNSTTALQSVSIFLYFLENKFKKNKPILPVSFELTDGPFRYYNFESAEKVREYFEYWEEAQKIAFTNKALVESMGFTGFILGDYTTVAAANLYAGIAIENFNNIIYDIELHYEDRYFLPRSNTATLGLPIKAANSIDEFNEINKETEKEAREKGAWPNVDPKVNYKIKDI